MTTLSQALRGLREEREVLMSDVVASVITTSSQEGRDGEARVNIKRRRKGMIKSASL